MCGTFAARGSGGNVRPIVVQGTVQVRATLVTMRLFVAVLALVTAGCGDSSAYELAGPASVVPPLQANVSGRYIGTMAYASAGQRGALTIVVRLHQSGMAFDGDWGTLYDGTITGTVAGVLETLDVPTTLNARWTFDAPNTSGGRCGGSTMSRGTGFPLVLSAASMSILPCVPLENIQWRLELDKGTLN